MNNLNTKRVNLKVFSKAQKTALVILLGICFALAVFIPMLLSSNMLFSTRTSRTYLTNELSDEDLLSPITFTYIDEEKTEALRMEAEERVLPYFYVSYGDTISIREKAEDMYQLYSGTMDVSKQENLIHSENPESYVVLRSSIGDNGAKIAAIAKDCILHFIYSGVFKQEDISYVISEKKQNLMMETVPDFGYTLKSGILDVQKVITEQSLRSNIYQWIINNYNDLKYDEIQLVADLCQLMISPNVCYDEVYTEAMRELEKKSVEPVVVTVEKGDYILKTDTLVTAEQLRTLDILNTKRAYSFSFLSLVPRIIVAGFVLIFWFWYSVGCIAYDYRKAEYTLITVTMMAFSIFGGFLLTWFLVNKNIRSVDGFMPFLIAPMIGTSITSRRTYGTATTLVLISLYCLWPTSDSMSFFYLVACSSAVVMTIKSNNGRFQTILIALKTVLYLVLLTVIFGLLTSRSFTDILINGMAISVNVIASFVFYAILLPILENAFNIPTRQRLNELAYTDNAILNQLSQVAQGTYNHVKNVSELAYAASIAIGANAELALVGARYHDIGKMVHPEYFVENQNGKNAHDNISSLLSRSVIKSHVRLGTEKGKEIGLPQEILDIIGEHHGNDIIRYFYNEAMKNASEKDNVVREDFMYDGNIPSTKESGIVMLADCVEAATRTIKKPNHQKYEKFINSIVSEKIAHGQLDNSGLTMSDLKVIKEAFIQPLFGRDHQRISYDNDKD